MAAAGKDRKSTPDPEVKGKEPMGRGQNDAMGSWGSEAFAGNLTREDLSSSHILVLQGKEPVVSKMNTLEPDSLAQVLDLPWLAASHLTSCFSFLNVRSG